MRIRQMDNCPNYLKRDLVDSYIYWVAFIERNVSIAPNLADNERF